MTFLDKILETKRQEVAELKRSNVRFDTTQKREIRSLRFAIQHSEHLAVISEMKRKSPSKGLIQAETDPVARALVYERAGAAAISVLTDSTYFGGSCTDLTHVRNAVSIPVLRKDFIIDEIQIDEAYAAGADAILLIASALGADRLRQLSEYAKAIHLDVLLEVHSADELPAALEARPSVLGVNNRDLRTFDVHLSTTQDVLEKVPEDTVAIAESGVLSEDDARLMANAGAQGILVGELLMRYADLSDVEACLNRLHVLKSSVSHS